MTGCSALEGADALINLAGRTVDCRYTPANRRAIMRSRLESTWALVEAIKRCAVPPRVFLQSSHGDDLLASSLLDAANDEFTGILGGDEPNWLVGYVAVLDRGRESSGKHARLEVPTPRTRKVAHAGGDDDDARSWR